MNQKQLDREWKRLLQSEQKFLNKNLLPRESGWQQKVEKYIPDKLDDTLDKAFEKAFELIFEKGTGIIEKTYDKTKKEQDYQIQEYTARVRGNKKSVKVFRKKAQSSTAVNTAISAIEGVGMGLFGVGIPDIPVFLSVVLKSIYEIALHYGFSYDTPQEQQFILLLIETALSHKDTLIENNMKINRWIDRALTDCSQNDASQEIKEQLEKTSKVLADELLYQKFLQTIPVVGIAGGISDVTCQKKISAYAMMKYNRRFLVKQKNKNHATNLL